MCSSWPPPGCSAVLGGWSLHSTTSSSPPWILSASSSPSIENSGVCDMERLIRARTNHHVKDSEKRVLARKALMQCVKSQELGNKLCEILIKKISPNWEEDVLFRNFHQEYSSINEVSAKFLSEPWMLDR